MTLFSSAGMIIKLPAESTVLGFTLWDDYDPLLTFRFDNRLGMATSIQTMESSLYQLRTMFNDKWYINVFGDNPGMLAVSGMFAGGGCGDVFSAEGQPAYSGFELMAMYYRQHRVSARYEPILIAIGGFMQPMLYDAFLVDCNVAAVDPQLQIGQFSMKFVYPMPDAPEELFDEAEWGELEEGLPEGSLSALDYGQSAPNAVSYANSLLP